MKKPTPTLEKITPALAKQWLDPSINHDNRTYRPNHAVDLAREMAAGRWTFNNDAICFGADGRLLNGQHRLHAIVISGKTIEMFVLRGMSDGDFKNMDGGGLKRQNHERIHLVNDFAQNHMICLAIRAYIHETGGSHGAISIGEIENEFLHRDVAWTWVGEQAVGMAAALKKSAIMAAVGIYRFVKPEKAAVFMDGYRTGVGLTEESPILRLRNMAMLGNKADTSYWRCVSLMRAHLQGRSIAMVFPAAEDMLGTKNSLKLIAKRTAVRKKGAETRKRKQRDGGDEMGVSA